jgi:hypothetical protein
MIVSIDLPWELVLSFLVDNPDAEVLGRVNVEIDGKGGLLTHLCPRGIYGVRVRLGAEA